jgi:sugar phosphate isomerase/epimerase
MTTRRDFLSALGAASLAGALPGTRNWKPRAPRAKIKKIGLQLYTVRDAMAKDVDATLAAVARVGYKEVEFAGYFDKPPQQLRATLDSLGLVSPASHLDLKDLETNFDATAAAAKTLGNHWLIVAWLEMKEYPTAGDWKKLAARFTALGHGARDAGMRFAYHNHDFEFALVDGIVPYDTLLAYSDPSVVDFEMDLYWIIKAGGTPLDYFAKYPGRFPLVHVKDGMGAPTWAMTDVGNGTINWKAIFAKQKQAGIQHFFVEHDEPKDAVASITASYNYLSHLTF